MMTANTTWTNVAADSVSVIMPCYNGAAYLREAIDSALAQTHPPLEILVIDDGSTDDSAALAASYGSPVRVISQANQGESVARNRGIDEAQGEWIGLLDADDLWRPTKLAAQLSIVTPEITAVHSNYSFFGARQDAIDLTKLEPGACHDLVRLCLLHNPHYHISSVLVRRSMATRFPTCTRYGEDLIYFLELLLEEPGGVILCAQDLVAARRHGSNQTRQRHVQLEWHKTVSRWTAENEARLPVGAAEAIEQGLVERLARETEYCYWRRDWPNYWTFRSYLADHHAECPAVRELKKRTIYPFWVYRVKDWFDRPNQTVANPAQMEEMD